MARRFVGFGFCAVAALLFASRYFCAAILGSGFRSMDADTFRALYGYVGATLTAAAGVFLAVGVGYIVWGELTSGAG